MLLLSLLSVGGVVITGQIVARSLFLSALPASAIPLRFIVPPLLLVAATAEYSRRLGHAGPAGVRARTCVVAAGRRPRLPPAARDSAAQRARVPAAAVLGPRDRGQPRDDPVLDAGRQRLRRARGEAAVRPDLERLGDLERGVRPVPRQAGRARAAREPALAGGPEPARRRRDRGPPRAAARPPARARRACAPRRGRAADNARGRRAAARPAHVALVAARRDAGRAGRADGRDRERDRLPARPRAEVGLRRATAPP